MFLLFVTAAALLRMPRNDLEREPRHVLVLGAESTVFGQGYTEYEVHDVLRPYLDVFCSSLAPYYDIVLFTTTPRVVANQLRDMIQEETSCVFKAVYDQSHSSIQTTHIRDEASRLTTIKRVKHLENLLPSLSNDLGRNIALKDVVYVEGDLQHLRPDADLPPSFNTLIESNRARGIALAPFNARTPSAVDMELVYLIQPLQLLTQCSITLDGTSVHEDSMLLSACPTLNQLLTTRRKDRYLLVLDMDKTILLVQNERGKRSMFVRGHLTTLLDRIAPLYMTVILSAGSEGHVRRSLASLKENMGIVFDRVLDRESPAVIGLKFTSFTGEQETVFVKSVATLLNLIREGEHAPTMQHTVFVDDAYIHMMSVPPPGEREFILEKPALEAWKKHTAGNKEVSIRVHPIEPSMMGDNELLNLSDVLIKMALLRLDVTQFLDASFVSEMDTARINQMWTDQEAAVIARYTAAAHRMETII